MAELVAKMYEFEITKRNGRKRKIVAPNKKQKEELRAELTKLYTIPLHPSAHGFVPGRNIVTNALPHVGFEVTINFDLENFFDSINYLEHIKGKIPYNPSSTMGTRITAPELISGFIHHSRLPHEEDGTPQTKSKQRTPMLYPAFKSDKPNEEMPVFEWDEMVDGKPVHRSASPVQGFPTSPAISNIVAKLMDEKIEAWLKGNVTTESCSGCGGRGNIVTGQRTIERKGQQVTIDVTTPCSECDGFRVAWRGKFAYTRYADDLSISLKKPSKELIERIVGAKTKDRDGKWKRAQGEIPRIIRNLRFRENPAKTQIHYDWKGNRGREVCGVLVLGSKEQGVNGLKVSRKKYRHRLRGIKHQLTALVRDRPNLYDELQKDKDLEVAMLRREKHLVNAIMGLEEFMKMKEPVPLSIKEFKDLGARVKLASDIFKHFTGNSTPCRLVEKKISDLRETVAHCLNCAKVYPVGTTNCPACRRRTSQHTHVITTDPIWMIAGTSIGREWPKSNCTNIMRPDAGYKDGAVWWQRLSGCSYSFTIDTDRPGSKEMPKKFKQMKKEPLPLCSAFARLFYVHGDLVAVSRIYGDSNTDKKVHFNWATSVRMCLACKKTLGAFPPEKCPKCGAEIGKEEKWSKTTIQFMTQGSSIIRGRRVIGAVSADVPHPSWYDGFAHESKCKDGEQYTIVKLSGHLGMGE